MQTSFAHNVVRSLRLLCLPLLLQLGVFPASSQRAEFIDSLDPLSSARADRRDVLSTPSGTGAPVLPRRWLESKPDPAIEDSVPQGALLRVAPNEVLSLSRLKSGSLVSGTLLRPLYCQDREVVPVGSQIQLVVETIEKHRPTRSLGREFAARLWNPLSKEEAAYSVVFRSAGLKLPDGRSAAVNVSFGRLLRFVRIQPKPSMDGGVPEPAGKHTNQNDGVQSLQSTLPQQAGKQSGS